MSKTGDVVLDVAKNQNASNAMWADLLVWIGESIANIKKLWKSNCGDFLCDNNW
jgi:hypothetical protein